MAGKTVIILDDDEAVRTLIARFCAKLRLQPVVFADPRHFSAVQDAARPDVAAVITDVFMPGLNGLDVVRVVRALDDAPKVIAVSGGWSTATPDETLKAASICDADAVLGKPFSFATFAAALKDAGLTVQL